MVKAMTRANLFVFAASFAFGQPQAAPTFEVATIKPAPAQSPRWTQTQMSSDTETGKLIYSNVNLKEVIGQAFKVQQYQISGPSWIETERFDIVAKFPPRSARDQVLLMLQGLLADRFKLTLHRETKELPVYALVVGKNGPKLTTTETETGITSNSNRTSWHVVAKISMRLLAEFLTNQVGRPVVDQTGLTGPYEITLDWAVDNPTSNEAAPGPSIFTALQEQLGLKLDSTKGPVETIVVDHSEKTPPEN
jgi:uncharacterized protein (TIGR03435 family)